ncbi:MAG: alkylphosphonate utilization protein [Alphaproteobacteria bacterium]|nr:alkylphosphonate utilization protein [Alphaproteobacteria bacterium]
MSCELCGSDEVAGSFDVEGVGALEVCGTCLPQLQPGAALDADHWQCLQGAIWSESAAVQVASYRIAARIDADWARELLACGALSDELLAKARVEAADAVKVVDAHGAELRDGDAVTLIKDLDVKGAGFTAKRGTLVKGIRLTDDPGLVEGRVNKTAIYLKTEFLKKA